MTPGEFMTQFHTLRQCVAFVKPSTYVQRHVLAPVPDVGGQPSQCHGEREGPGDGGPVDGGSSGEGSSSKVAAVEDKLLYMYCSNNCGFQFHASCWKVGMAEAWLPIRYLDELCCMLVYRQ